MSYTKRKLEDLNLLDDFLMNAVTSNETVGVPFCRRLLSELFQREISEIKVISQRVLVPATPDQRGIRLDVEVRESLDNTPGSPSYSMYDIEPYLMDTKRLPKHNRFYQARIDSRHMHSGEQDFSLLPNLYVITITRDDPFGKDQMVYTIRNACREIPELEYPDGLVYYYFNTTGTQGGTAAIKALLDYLGSSRKNNIKTEAIRELDQYVTQVKQLPEVRDSFMRFEDIIYWEKSNARNEGRQEGAKSAQIRSILDLLEEFQPIPETLTAYLSAENDIDVLRRWVKLAARSSTLEEFEEKIGAR